MYRTPLRVVLATLASFSMSCSSTVVPPPAVAGLEGLERREVRRILREAPVITLRSDPDDCDYLGIVYGGPGIGIKREQEIMRQKAFRAGATHMVYQDQETAHMWKCASDPGGDPVVPSR